MKSGLFFRAVVFAASLSAGLAFAEVDLKRILVEANDLDLASDQVHPYLHDPDVRSRLNLWLNHPANHVYVHECQRIFRPYFPSEKIIGPLCYFLRQDDTANRAKYIDIAWRWYLEARSALYELAQDPRFPESDRQKAASYYKKFRPDDRATLKSCMDKILLQKYAADHDNNFFQFQQAKTCLREKFDIVEGVPYFSVNIPKVFKNHPGHAVSPKGWIGGNKVVYLTKNDNSDQLTNLLASKHQLVPGNYPLTGDGSYEAMLKKDPKDVFTESEGFFDIKNSPIWNQPDGTIYREIYREISEAKESIFIDLFFIGGVMGTSMAKHLVEKAEQGVKVLILRDNYNHFGHDSEMRPVYNFLLAYSQKNPSKMVIAQSHIKAHPTGLPKMLDKIVSDEFLERSGIQDHLALYGKAKSDHSKVVVIDGKGKDPVAFVGSKNWTDGAGVMAYDEVAQVTGPAAAMVLDDYYYDMFYALFYEMKDSFVDNWAANGWARGQPGAGGSKRDKVAAILKPFDLLERNGAHKPGLAGPVKVNTPGSSLVRTGMNNWNSTRTNCVDQVIQMIINARRRIFIKDQYVFDRNVILALLDKKREIPSIDIRMILEPRKAAKPSGMPNLLYLDIMNAAGIRIKWKTVNDNVDVAHQNHMKTISADGQSVITGSANKDQTTMYGSFREEQLDIWDPAVTKVHDDAFLAHWDSMDETSAQFSGYDFQVPAGLKGLNGKPMTPQQFIATIRNIVSILFDAGKL